MPSPIPTPVAAAIGIVPTVLSGVRALPGKAVQLPVLALSSALNALDGARREYDGLAERGERLLARLRSGSFDEFEDRVENVVAHTPLAGAYELVEDAVEAALDRAGDVGRRLERATDNGGRLTRATDVGRRLERATSAFEGVADAVVGDLTQATRAGVQAAGKVTNRPTPALAPDQTAAKGVPTPKATQPDATRVDTAASPAVVAVVQQVVEASVVAVNHDTHEELPVEDYDHLTLGSLRGRLRSLDVGQLIRLRTYEKAHANRLPVVTMLDNRIAKLATDAAATPSPDGPVPPAANPSIGGKVVGAATARKRAPRTKVRTT